MKKKIYLRIVFIAILSIISTMFLLTAVYYNLYRKQIMDDLRVYTNLVKECDTMEELVLVSQNIMHDGIRITIVDTNGTVLYDNITASEKMENHKERPEIRQAYTEGEGQAVRKSLTLSKSTFYYASRIQDGKILRVSRDVGSLYSVLWQALPSIVFIMLLLMGMSFVTAHLLTRNLLAPIEKMAENLDEENKVIYYEELEPFVQTIRKQHQDIMKSAMVRQEFTANVTHELKTPLTAISGYSELIESGMASPQDTIRFAHGIHSSANRLISLINDIIRLSELDSEQEEIVVEELNLYQLADTCVEMLRLNADKHKVDISIEGSNGMILGNRMMIEEVLYNLCDNAIRYNKEGGSVTVQVIEEGGRTILRVKDSGIGIPKEHLDRIFERFYRVDKSRSKSTGGTGLGLAIVKHIVGKHNALIQVDSEIGVGSTISIYFESIK